jgi:glutamate racemase
MSNIKIGVFDSGIGGLSVAHAIKKAISDIEVIYKDDSQHVPYGTRSIEEIYEFTIPILKSLEQEGCEVIIVACNTVTTNLIDRLRQEISVQLIGIEPMVKVAAEATKTGVIAICATPRTNSAPLKAQQFLDLYCLLRLRGVHYFLLLHRLNHQKQFLCPSRPQLILWVGQML